MSIHTYIGVKEVHGTPMTRAQYNKVRGLAVPSDENPEDEGYLVEYVDGGAANHPDFAGYIAWSPADVFNRAYRPTTGMTFGLALEAIKLGRAVARSGWNGKGMFISMSPGIVGLPAANFWSSANRAFAEGNGGHADVLPSISMKTADGKILMGWLASQTDMFAEDWEVVG